MNGPIRSDEELESELAEHLANPNLTDDEKARIHDAHDAMMVARKAERAAAQARYDSGKGKSPAKAFRMPLPAQDKGRGTS